MIDPATNWTINGELTEVAMAALVELLDAAEEIAVKRGFEHEDLE